jgi:hypothetical protein
MQRLSGICLFAVLCGSVASSQTAAVPSQWSGTWTLSLQESRMPAGVLGETMVITSTAGHLKIGSDVVTSVRGSSREELNLDIDGKETVFPEGPRLSLKRSDDTTFDIIISVNNKKFGNHIEEVHFVFSADGNKLTETRTHTEREVVPEGVDQAQGKVLRTSTSDLVFYKILFIPPAGPVFLRPMAV